MAKTIIIDAGHGGLDNGAMYRGRKEKDDNLKLAMSLGELLEKNGYTVEYTRTDDRYQSPFEKAQVANQMGGDLFLSIHRDFDDEGEAQGAKAFVFKQGGVADEAAKEMLKQLQEVGFNNLGVEVRNGLAVLKRTVMPAVLLEVGYINSAEDNRLFDTQFSRIVSALADAIKEVIPLDGMETEEVCLSEEADYRQEEIEVQKEGCLSEETFYERDMVETQLEYREQKRYWVQTGVFGFYENAAYQKELLEDDGYTVQIVPCNAGYSVRIGGCDSIDEAAGLQKVIRNKGYETLIISE